MIKSNNKLTLEQRIAYLENAVNSNDKSCKFENFESKLDEHGARAKADHMAKQFANMLGVSVTPDNLDVTVSTVTSGWVTTDDADLIEEDSRFVFQYTLDDGNFVICVIPSDDTVTLMTEGGYAVSPDGSTFEPELPQDDAFPMSDWSNFDLSMIRDEDDEDDY